MLFGKPKAVQVITKAGLDAALAAANTDNIVVVGGDSLLRCAEQKAGNDPDVIAQTETRTTTSELHLIVTLTKFLQDLWRI